MAACNSCRHRPEQGVRRELPAIKRRAAGVDADCKCAESIPASVRDPFLARIADIRPMVAIDAAQVHVGRERDESALRRARMGLGDRRMSALKPLDRFPSESPPIVLEKSVGEVSATSTARAEPSRDSPPPSPSSWCTALFFLIFALIVAAAVAADSNWHNPLVVVFIVVLAVWGRAHSVKVTSSESTKDSHATCLNGVCIVALAALNGPLPAVLAAFAQRTGSLPVTSLPLRRQAFNVERSGLQSGLCGCVCPICGLGAERSG